LLIRRSISVGLLCGGLEGASAIRVKFDAKARSPGTPSRRVHWGSVSLTQPLWLHYFGRPSRRVRALRRGVGLRRRRSGRDRLSCLGPERCPCCRARMAAPSPHGPTGLGKVLVAGPFRQSGRRDLHSDLLSFSLNRQTEVEVSCRRRPARNHEELFLNRGAGCNGFEA
jgi:hypothetical protein